MIKKSGVFEERELTAVILNYNSAEETIRLANSLFEKLSNVSVIIIDNNSNDVTTLRNFIQGNKGSLLIESAENLGYARGNNIGLMFLNSLEYSGYVLVVNPDVEIIDWDFFPFALDKFCADDTIAFIAPLMLHNGRVAYNAIRNLPTLLDDLLAPIPIVNELISRNPIRRKNSSYTLDTEMLPGSFLLGSFSTWQRLEFFDNNTFLFGEERILGSKVKSRGLKNVIATQYTYSHKDSLSINKYYDAINKFDLHLKGRLIFIKYYSKYKRLHSILYWYYKLSIDVRKVFI